MDIREMVTGYGVIEAALLKKKPSRTPCFPLIDTAFAAAYSGKSLREVQTDPELHAAALEKCARELPVDGVYINLSLGQHQPVRLSEDTFRIDNALTLSIPLNDVLSIAETDIETLDDERIISAQLFHPGILETFESMKGETTNQVAVVVGLTGTFSQVAFLYGISPCMMALVDRPDEVRRALDRRHEVVLQQARDLCNAGAHFIWIGEGLGSGSLISPRQYQDFVLPYERSLTTEIRRAGALSILHICGDVTGALPHIAGSGADGFDLDYPVDLSTALDILLPEVAVKGNIDPTLFLKGHQESLRGACMQALQSAGDAAGFILSTGCLVPRDAEVESFLTMSELCS
jgi:uroporphyrinogen decarboxylase